MRVWHSLERVRCKSRIATDDADDADLRLSVIHVISRMLGFTAFNPTYVSVIFLVVKWVDFLGKSVDFKSEVGKPRQRLRGSASVVRGTRQRLRETSLVVEGHRVSGSGGPSSLVEGDLATVRGTASVVEGIRISIVNKRAINCPTTNWEISLGKYKIECRNIFLRQFRKYDTIAQAYL